MRLDQVKQNYDRAAKYYDPLADVVFGRILGLEKYRQDVIERLGDLRGATVVDVGCGTGRNFPFLVPRVGEHGRVLGVDYSEGMLEQARGRVRRNGWPNVELLRADAATLEGVPEHVDALVGVWCYGIVYDLEKALNRAVDVLRPGGRIALMDFEKSRPDEGLLRWLYPIYSRALQFAGIDTAEDLDNAELQAKWKRGRQVLRTRLVDFREQTYLQDTGIIFSGAKSEAEPSTGRQPDGT